MQTSCVTSWVIPMTEREAELEARIRELEADLEVLQSENQGLAGRAEDTLLLSMLAEEIQSAPTPTQVFSQGLERISILKDVPLCLACTLVSTQAVVVAGFLSTSEANPVGSRIDLGGQLASMLAEESVYLAGAECQQVELGDLGQLTGFQPECTMLIPTQGEHPEVDLFLFADDRADEHIMSLSLMLHRSVEMMSARAANLRLMSELVAVNSELTRASKARGDFMAAMSHELRTPLNSIIGFSSILLQGMAGDLNSEQHRQLTMISDSGRHLLSLISNVLDLAKVESGTIELSLSSIDLSELARSLGDSVLPMAHEKGLELVVSVPSGLTITSDRVKVSQILLNLLSNAVKFTNTGSVELGVAQQGGSHLKVWVRDTGVGIPPESLSVIFEQFHQLSPAGQEAKTTGAGLGLAISQQVARLLGGEITVTSQVGSGSTFTLVLPIEPTTEAAGQEGN